jgi:hypothetical protein
MVDSALKKPVVVISVVAGCVLVLVIIAIILVVVYYPSSSTSLTTYKYNLPADGNVYAISAESIYGTLGNFWSMSTQLQLVDANWCSATNQDFKFIKYSDGATPDRAIYRIQCCATGQYLTATYSGLNVILTSAAIDGTTSSQLWEVVQTLNQNSIHNFPTSNFTGATTLGVFAFKSVLFAKNISAASPPVMSITNYESDVKQRWSLQQVTCTMTCNWS